MRMTTQEQSTVERTDPAPLTFGRPRADRVRRQRVTVLAALIVPTAAVGGLGAYVIDSYWDHVAAKAAASAPVVEPVGHAPTGPDVGTQGLTPAMTRAVTRAQEAAAAAGVTLNVVSGYRTADAQQRLFDEAVTTYGSAKEASRWVLPPNRSEHVRGGAVDVGPAAAATWLEQKGVSYGLCRRYVNEPWHFELLAPAKGQPCPALEKDAAS